MNRIREIREDLAKQMFGKKFSYQAVADACEPQTTAKQIQRLENAERSLRQEWLERLAKAFTKLGIPTKPVNLLPKDYMPEQQEYTQSEAAQELQHMAEEAERHNIGLSDQFLNDALRTAGSALKRAIEDQEKK